MLNVLVRIVTFEFKELIKCFHKCPVIQRCYSNIKFVTSLRNTACHKDSAWRASSVQLIYGVRLHGTPQLFTSRTDMLKNGRVMPTELSYGFCVFFFGSGK